MRISSRPVKKTVFLHPSCSAPADPAAPYHATKKKTDANSKKKITRIEERERLGLILVCDFVISFSSTHYLPLFLGFAVGNPCRI